MQWPYRSARNLRTIPGQALYNFYLEILISQSSEIIVPRFAKLLQSGNAYYVATAIANASIRHGRWNEFNFLITKAVRNVLSLIPATYNFAFSGCQKFVSLILRHFFCRRISIFGWRTFDIFGRIQGLVNLKDACSIRLALIDHCLLIWQKDTTARCFKLTKCICPSERVVKYETLISVARW